MDERTRFTAVWETYGWRVEATDPAVRGPLEELLREQVRLQTLPLSLPLVGHCAFGARYCVLVRAPGEPTVRGVLLDAADYRELGFDPFAAGASLIGTAVLVELVEHPPAPVSTDVLAHPEGPGYLDGAYACFLAAPTAARREAYLSLLPPGTPREVSPLSCFTALAGEPAGDEPHVGALELARDTEPETADPAPTAAPNDVLARLESEHRRLRRALTLTWVALVLVAVAAAAAAWIGRGRLEALERGKLDTAVVVEGLGVAPDERTTDQALRASLRDLATVSIQSGAWQSGLESRGVEPDRFLGTMVELAARADELERLAAAATPLTRLAPASGELVGLARRSEPLGELAGAAPALVTVAERAPALAALAERRTALEAVAARDEALVALAQTRADLEAVARLRAPLERLAGRATAIANLAEQGAPLLVFFERRQGALERLAQEQPALSELAARRPALERLAGAAGPLGTLAESRGLRALAARDTEVVLLSQHLEELTELARRAEELLARPPAP